MTEAATRTCAACLAEIPTAAVRCQHCGSDPRGRIDWSRPSLTGLVSVVALVLGIGYIHDDDGMVGLGIGLVVVAVAGLVFLAWELSHLERKAARKGPN